MKAMKEKINAPSIQKKLPEKLWLPILAFAVEMSFPRLLAPQWVVFSIEYSLLIAFVFYNLKAKSSWPYWIGMGTFMNFTVIAANKFAMPISPAVFSPEVDSTLLASLIKGDIYGYVLAGPDTLFPLLGDIIKIAPFGHLIGFASIGDLLLLVGVVIAIYRIR